MKYVARRRKEEPKGKVVIDRKNEIFNHLEDYEIYNSLLPYNKIYEEIVVLNYYSIPKALLHKLTIQYLHGAKIIFDIPSRNFYKEYKLNKYSPIYSYKFEPLDLSAPIVKSLANFKFIYQGEEKTYREVVSTLTNTRYLPNELWNALDIYSQQLIEECKQLNKGNYSLAEKWYKDLTKDCMLKRINVYSPNEKTYFEASAELEFELRSTNARLKEGEQPLTEDQLNFLEKYSRVYGVKIPKFQWRYNTRKTKHGYTEEIERMYADMSDSDWAKIIYDPRNADKQDYYLPKQMRSNLVIQSCENDKLLKDAYDNLMWIINNLGDEGFMPGWHRCPHCGEIYHEQEGCECGHATPIEFLQANNLFYSSASEWEDYAYTKDYLGDDE